MALLLPASGYRRMPWKNGGGETFEIAVSPPDAALDQMDWRISMAVVASDGPFSSFPDVDRTLTILEGDGMQLELGTDRAPFALRRDTPPFHFPGDVPTQARLLGGTVTDLNVMTRRSRYRHNVRRLQVSEAVLLETTALEAAVFCMTGTVTCAAQNDTAVVLRERDCTVFRATPGRISVATTSPATLLFAEFFRA